MDDLVTVAVECSEVIIGFERVRSDHHDSPVEMIEIMS